MDTSKHTMDNLFAQLGLQKQPNAIECFIAEHRGLAPNVQLSNASFWSQSQSAFIQEAIDDDSDWSEVVDQLDSRLR